MDGDGLLNSTPTRRRFLAAGVTGAAVATIPLLDGRAAFAERAAVGSARKTDPLFDQIGREIARIHTSATASGGVGAQHLHGFASQLRLALTQAHATDLDRTVMAGLGSALDARGRDSVLDGEPDLDRVAARLRANGMDVSKGRPRAPLTRDEKSRCLNELLVGGVTPKLAEISAILTSLEPKADKVLTGGAERKPQVVPVIDGCLGWGLICLEMRGISYLFDLFAPEIGWAIWACSYMCELLEWAICAELLGG
jgi:hypothetical protein